jgi:hypothetical protein
MGMEMSEEQFRFETEKRLSIPELVRWAYREPEEAGARARWQGDYVEFCRHMEKVHRRLVRRYK